MEYVNFETALAAMRKGKMVKWDRDYYWIDKHNNRIVRSGWLHVDISDIILFDRWIITNKSIKDEDVDVES